MNFLRKREREREGPSVPSLYMLSYKENLYITSRFLVLGKKWFRRQRNEHGQIYRRKVEIDSRSERVRHFYRRSDYHKFPPQIYDCRKSVSLWVEPDSASKEITWELSLTFNVFFSKPRANCIDCGCDSNREFSSLPNRSVSFGGCWGHKLEFDDYCTASGEFI